MNFNLGKKDKDNIETSGFFANKAPEQTPDKDSPFDRDITNIVENSWRATKVSKRKDIFFMVLMEAMQVQQQREIMAKMDQLISAVSRKEDKK